MEQLTLIPEPTKKQARYDRKCEECGKDYKAMLRHSKFCSNVCRAAWNRKNGNKKIAEGAQQQDVKQTSSLPAAIVSPAITGLPPHLQIAVDLLKNEARRWEKSYDDAASKLEKANDRIKELEKKMSDKEHEVALQGIENQKPDVIDRVLNGLSNMPAPIVEQFAPLIGRLGSLLVPSGAAAVQGVQGQLDEPQIQFINWINGLPPETQKSFMMAMAELSRFDEAKLHNTITQINQFLKVGTTAQRTPDVSMYGS